MARHYQMHINVEKWSAPLLVQHTQHGGSAGFALSSVGIVSGAHGEIQA